MCYDPTWNNDVLIYSHQTLVDIMCYDPTWNNDVLICSYQTSVDIMCYDLLGIMMS